jgi:flagellar capping protein FliD
MKLKIFILVSVFFLIFFIGFTHSEVTARFKNVKCTSSVQTIDPGFKCFVKAYNRKVAKSSIIFDLKRQCDEVMVGAR